MAKQYVPDAGEIVWINFTPQAGHEQAGHRPALVLSPAAYNGKTSLMICCPLTTQIKNYPFEVFIAARRRMRFWQIGSRALTGAAGTLNRRAVCRRINWLKCGRKYTRSFG
jgi:mRNA-degrading endonuclease toxin of MazEF toxin-antitoxin module